MVIKGKECVTWVCRFWMFLCVAGLIATFLPILGLIAPSIMSPEKFEEQVPKDEQEEFRTNSIILLIYLLVTTTLRFLGTWKLSRSLKLCETNASQAIMCVDMWLTAESIILVMSWFILSLLACFLIVLFELGFILCVANFKLGIRNEIIRQGQLPFSNLIFGVGNAGFPVRAALNGYGPLLPVPTNDGIYPLPTPTPMTTFQQNETVAPQIP